MKHKIKIWKSNTDTFKNMWRGQCICCDKTWQYWAFGATLGYGLEWLRREAAK